MTIQLSMAALHAGHARRNLGPDGREGDAVTTQSMAPPSFRSLCSTRGHSSSRSARLPKPWLRRPRSTSTCCRCLGLGGQEGGHDRYPVDGIILSRSACHSITKRRDTATIQLMMAHRLAAQASLAEALTSSPRSALPPRRLVRRAAMHSKWTRRRGVHSISKPKAGIEPIPSGQAKVDESLRRLHISSCGS